MTDFLEVDFERKSTADNVADLLRDMVVRGDLAPGTPLREVSVARSLGVSRPTLREALRLLAREGVVRHHMHRGTVVTDIGEEDVADIFRVRRLLEAGALHALPNLGGERIAALHEAMDGLRDAAQRNDQQLMVESDLRFHAAIVGLVGSERLDRIYGELLSELRLCFTFKSHIDEEYRRSERMLAEHGEIFAAVECRDARAARDMLLAHLEGSERRVSEILRLRAEGTHGED